MKTIGKLILIFLTMLSCMGVQGTSAAMWCDFSSYCSHVCDSEPCSEVFWDGFCEPWENIYGWLVYVGYKRMYDCDGIECVCEGMRGIDIADFPTKGECLEVYCGRHIVDQNKYISCMFTGNFPPPPCDDDDQCCFGGNNGSGSGSGGSGGAGSPPPPIPIIATVSHSPSLKVDLQYNHNNKVDRGLGVGWSHTYLYSFNENDDGNIIITGNAGFPFLYVHHSDGTYESAPYDRTILTRDGGTFVATLKDGTKYLYNNSRLERVEDLAGNFQTLSYSSQGFLESVSDNFGRTIQFNYTENNGLYRLQRVTDPNNNSYSFLYQDDNLIAIVYPDNTQRRFEYNDPNGPHNLTRIIDNNGHTVVQYQYDGEGRIIKKSGEGDTNAIEINYLPATDLFSDDFEAGISSTWTVISGIVDLTDDPDQEHYTNHVIRMHPGSVTYRVQSGAVESLKASFDLWVGEENSQDFLVKIYDSTRGDEYGAWLKFASTGKVQAELIYEGSNRTIDIANGLSTGKWHKVIIEADAREDYTYFKVWIDCEYLGGYPFKRETSKLDTVIIDVQTNGSDISIDNFSLSEITLNGSKRITTDAQGNKQVLTILSQNEFGGKSYSYEMAGMVGKGCSSCSVSTKLYEYDAQWNLRRTVDGNNIITEMTYDDRGNMLTKTEAKGTALERRTTYTYHSRFNKVLIRTEASVDTAGENKSITYTYDDANGNLLREMVTGYSNGMPFTLETNYQYNSHGQVTQIDSPRNDTNDVTAYTYHPADGYLTSINYPNGTITYSIYDGNHNVGTITDLNGETTFYTYDYANRVKTITVGSAVTVYDYDPAGNIRTVTMPEGNRIHYEYDGSNRLTMVKDDLGDYISYEYDSKGNKTREEIHDTQGTLKKYSSFEYDQSSRLNKIKNPDNSSTGFAYDNNGNRTQMTRPGGEITAYEYDELNRLKKVIESRGTPEEAKTEYEYDSQDNLIEVKDAEEKVTRYSYDDMGRLIRTVSPDTGTTTYAYDEAGNLKTRTDAKGTATGFEYDPLNRLVKMDFPTDQDITYTYDETGVPYGIGRLTTMADASGTSRYSYDERGNVTEQRCTIEGRTFITGYEYNLNNVAKKISYPGGIVVEYGLDSIGKITGLTMNGNTIVSEVIYEPFGELQTMNFIQSGIGTTVARNNQYQISEIQAGTILHRTYTHDFDGNITYIQRSDSLPLPQVYTGTENYNYMTGKDWIQATNDGTVNYQYAYDANGNIISDGRFTYQYNENNQLVKVSDTSTVLGEYTYNGKGQRVKKVADGRTTIYHYDLTGNLIQETDQEGEVIASYIYAGTNRLAMVKPDGSIYYYHNDHLGTPLAMTDEGGNIVWKAAYDPFGQAHVDPASTVTNNFRFPGQYYDEESGLHYNWYRYYDPRTGRYITADPLLMPFFYNRKPHFLVSSSLPKPNKFLPYAYAKNNPLALIDIKGLVCGSGWTDDYIPDEPFGYDFTKCCQRHDDCYGDCCTPKSECDENFFWCMVLGCTEPACAYTADAYYQAVRIFGRGAFKNARESCL